MSQAAASPYPKCHGMDQTDSLGVGWNKLMMWLFLCSDGMSFAGLICYYFVVRMSDKTWPDPNAQLGIWLTTLMTFILICSSLTMVKSLTAAHQGDRAAMGKWLGLTVAGGAFFLGCQAYEWNHLFHEGHAITNNLFDATFFVMTGFHGCHVAGGVIYLGLLFLKTKMGRPPRPDSLESAGLYWHFVDLVWILIFTFVYLIPPPPGSH